MNFKRFNIILLAIIICATSAICLTGCSTGSLGDNTENTGWINMGVSDCCMQPDGWFRSAVWAEVFQGSGAPALIGTKVVFRTDLGSFANARQEFETTITGNDGKVHVSLIAGHKEGVAFVSAEANGYVSRVPVGIFWNWDNCPYDPAPDDNGYCSIKEPEEEEEPPPDEEEPPPDEEADEEEEPPAAYNILLSAAPLTIRANENESILLSAKILDSQNQPVQIGTEVTFTTTLGHFPNGEGSTSVTTLDETGRVSIRLSGGDEKGLATITCQAADSEKMMVVGFE